MEQFTTPEHLHAVLNHIPVVGIFACSLFLLYGLVRKNAEFIIFTQILILLFGASTLLVMSTGSKAEERFEHSPLVALLDNPGKGALESHEAQAKLAALGTYGLAGASLIVLLLCSVRPTLRVSTGWLILLGCVIVILLMGWAAQSGGQIRHPEFRTANAPSSS